MNVDTSIQASAGIHRIVFAVPSGAVVEQPAARSAAKQVEAGVAMEHHAFDLRRQPLQSGHEALSRTLRAQHGDQRPRAGQAGVTSLPVRPVEALCLGRLSDDVCQEIGIAAWQNQSAECIGHSAK